MKKVDFGFIRWTQLILAHNLTEWHLFIVLKQEKSRHTPHLCFTTNGHINPHFTSHFTPRSLEIWAISLKEKHLAVGALTVQHG